MKSLIEKHKYITAFLLSLLLGLSIILPWIIQGNGVFTFLADYNTQQIPFNIYMSDAISNNNYLWNWYNDLGASFIGSFGLYNVFSPFTIILWLFPAKIVPYLMGPMFMIKYGIAGLTSYLFLKRYVKNYKYALLGSLLYSFSGYQLTNMLFYHFHDVVALFPLLLFSLDKLVLDNKKGLFLIFTALNAITNYYFFIGQVVFVFIYYVVKIFTKQYKWSFKSFMAIFIESILGVGIAAFLLIPSALFVMGNPRISDSWTLYSMFRPIGTNIAEIIRAFIMPNESMSFRAMLTGTNYYSVEAYLPFVGSILWLSYLIKKPKSWSNILLLVLLIFMAIPILNSSFSMFTTSYYARWFYMAILIMVLNSIKALDENISIKNGVVSTCLLMILFWGLALYICRDKTLIYNQEHFIVIITVALINILLMTIIFKYNKSKDLLLFIFVTFYIVLYSNYFIYNNKKMALYENPMPTLNSLKEALNDLDDNVRYNANNYYFNVGLYAKKMFVSSWNTNIEASAFEFYNSLNIFRVVSTEIPIDDKELQNFLSIKYIVLSYWNENLVKLYGEPINKNGYYIYINNEYKPFGIDYNYYMLDTDYDSISYEDRAKILNNSVIINKDTLNKYEDLLIKYEEGMPYESNIVSNDFDLTNYGFTSNINILNESLIVYTVPYSSGWKATVNGESSEIIPVDNGFMAIKIMEGKNEIEFKYFPPGLKVGLIISGFSIFGSVIYLVINGRKKRK